MHEKILIIDDSLAMAKSLELQLKHKQYVVQIATRGNVGVETTKQFRPELIFLDIEMPQMDGFETLIELKKLMKQDYYAPIIMLSGHNSPEDVLKSIKNGAQDYILKPFNENHLFEKLKKYFPM